MNLRTVNRQLRHGLFIIKHRFGMTQNRMLVIWTESLHLFQQWRLDMPARKTAGFAFVELPLLRPLT